MKQYNVTIYNELNNKKYIKSELEKTFDIDNVVAIPTFKFLNLNNLARYNIFNLDKVTYDNLVSQLKAFDKTKLTLLYIDDILRLENEFDDIIKFAKLYDIKIVVNVGSTLDEMGQCDKIFGMSPIGVLEEYGVLDLEPVILSGANLDKEDYEKLSYYNASLCLNITNDMLKGNGIAKILTAKKYNINMFFNCRDIYKEMFLAYTLPRGILNNIDAISAEDVIAMACFNMEKVFKEVKNDTYNVFSTGSLLDIVLGNNLNIIDTIMFK